jgi:uncharacterized protein (DUF305 family)
MDPGAPPDRRSARGAVLAAALIAALVAGAAGYWAGGSRAAAQTPASTSAEAGFARDMQVHHLQGVEMAMVIRDRTDDPDVRQLAYDIATTQGHQAGQLYGWLAAWGLNQLGSEPPMAWMGHPGHDMGALMPGMASTAQMNELSAATGVDAERLFLTLMIAHHRGALEMADAVLDLTEHPVVLAFARAVLTSQQSEIELMTMMLEQRSATPRPRS